MHANGLPHQVSSKTNYLLRGCDENGQPMESSKVTKAREQKGCKVSDEEGL